MIKRLGVWMLFLLVATACGGTTQTTPPADTGPLGAPDFIEPASSSEIEAIYGANCSGCHGANGQGMGAIPALDASGHAWHHPDAYLGMTIYNGRAPMPAFGKALSKDEILGLIAYIKSLWGPNELEQQRIIDDTTR